VNIIQRRYTPVKHRLTREGKRLLREQLREIVAAWLQAAMDAKGWDQTRTASEAGVSRVTVWNFLNKEVDATDDKLERLARALEVEVPRVAQLPTVPKHDVPSSANATPGAESGAPHDFDLAEEIARYPEQFARRMETTAADVGPDLAIAFIDDAEKILRQNGLDFTVFLAALRARLRAQRPATNRNSA
jgi:transcriptional regulator with XRE-family HTH domain